jgi:hypothetical protein
MRRGFALFAILCLVAAGSALARAPETPLLKKALLPGEWEDGMAPPRGEFTRVDTVWFGADDGAGNALFSPDLADPNDAKWTWDHGGADPFEGWTSVDMTVNDGVYFYRVNAAAFAGDPCVPMFPGEVGEIWCGMHEAAADAHDWVGGMGYANDFCQSAKSPYLTCVGLHNVTVGFKFFNDSEPLYDYTYLYVLAYDNAATPNLLEEIEVTHYDGIIGAYNAPVTQSKTMLAAELPAATQKVKVEFRFKSDGGWSDEDGYWLTNCGPLAVDDIAITVTGGGSGTYDFTTTAEGWTFSTCPGIGAFMAVWPQETWEDWITTVNLPCPCSLTNNVLGCVDTETPFPTPGHPVGQTEQMMSGLMVLDRNEYPATEYNTTIVQWDAFNYMRQSAGSFYRPGFKQYPYTTTVNPTPHWSQRLGQKDWYHTTTTPRCQNDGIYNLTQGGGMMRSWEQAIFIYEFITSCDAFGITPQNCRFEGQTYGAPLIDDLRVGVFGSVDAPLITLDSGLLFHDGFGQNFPTYLEPGDVGNSNVSYDNSRDDELKNDWHADSAMISGPMPSGRSWLCKLMMHVESKGPRQDMVPGYQYWKSRLTGDPETGYAAALMDSAQQSQQLVSNQAFSTYFHEDDPGFRGSPPYDYNEINEILPDGVFTPGTTIRYYYAPYWIDTPQIKGFYGLLPGGWEYQILPQMRPATRDEWDVEWPSVLYVDAFNNGSEVFIIPTLQQLGLEFDKYDALDRFSNYDAPMKRSFKGGTWGNNGCTTQQLLGYRLVLYNTGNFGVEAVPPEDFELFDEWLDATDCPDAASVRRGLILDGNGIGPMMDDPAYGLAADFMNQKLGATTVATVYRDYNEDEYDCLGLLASGSAVFTPTAPGASLYGNGCPGIREYAVLDVHATSGTPSVGNLLFKSYNPDAVNQTVPFAQIVRDMSNQASTNWKSVVDGFSFHQLSEYIAAGNECLADSIRIVDGAANVMGPMLQWITDVNDPFIYWQYPCEDSAIDEDTDGHLAGKVNYLYASRPNPFRNSATIRFQLANAGHVELSIYDVTGRLVRTLVDGDLKAGENSLVWDGTDNASNRVSGGVFWMQMSTNGFTSSKKMVVLR